jgi:SAM-dependent methyltransferase
LLDRPQASPLLAYEYLSPAEYLDKRRFEPTRAFLDLVHGWSIGWHYAVDLAFIFERSRSWPLGAHVLDAGGGRGPAQYLLLESGFDVTNVDLAAAPPSYLERKRYRASFEQLPSFVDTPYLQHLERIAGRPGGRMRLAQRRWPARLRALAAPLARELRQRASYRELSARRERWRAAAGLTSRPVGRLRLLRGNLARLPELDDRSFEAIVSLSALEHVPLAELPAVLAELARLTRPGGGWAITTSGSDRETWFHEPSKGLCFGCADLARLFRAVPSGALSAQAALEAYRQCDLLRERLTRFYFESGDNGMPWGVWDPRYVPVGLSAP